MSIICSFFFCWTGAESSALRSSPSWSLGRVEVATPGRSVGRPRHCLLHLASVSQGIVFLRTPPTRERALTFQHLSLTRSLARCSDLKRLPNISHGRLRKHPLPTTTLTLLLFTYLFSLRRWTRWLVALVFVLSLSDTTLSLGAREEVLLIKRQLCSLERSYSVHAWKWDHREIATTISRFTLFSWLNWHVTIT